MTAPSNANTSGLEVVAWLTTGGDVTRSEAYAKEQSVNDPENYPVGLVTAASAQARIAELERDKEELARTANEWTTEAHERLQKVDAAEARADRLAKALEALLSYDEQDAGCIPTNAHLDAQNDARAALQQETQP